MRRVYFMRLATNRFVAFNLWDGHIKPVEWFFGDDGESAFVSAFENIEEMNEAIKKDNWISIIFNVCYQSSKKPLTEKKNWLLKYFYEYILSRYSVRMTANEHTLILISTMACNEHFYPYPDCLDEEKHPLLHFFNRVKAILPEGYSEQTYPILKDIVYYIYNSFLSLDRDVSHERWMYDKSFYVDYKDKPQKYDMLIIRLKTLVEFPQYLRK